MLLQTVKRKCTCCHRTEKPSRAFQHVISMQVVKYRFSSRSNHIVQFVFLAHRLFNS